MTNPTPNIVILDAQEYTDATTARIGRRTVTVAIQLPSGVLTGEPNRSSDGLRVAMCYPWTEEDRLCVAEMFLSLEWADTLPEGWSGDGELLTA